MKPTRVLLAGGGSGGSVTPLLAVAVELRALDPKIEILFIGTHDGPERSLARTAGLPYRGVSAGKLRRYWDVQNLLDLGRIAAGFGESLGIARRFRPLVGLGAGGFGSVPPLAAARVLGMPVVIHQQDVEPGLANRLLLPLATAVTVALESSLAHFPAAHTTVVGNPVRPEILRGSAEAARERFRLELGLPTVLVTGGGTGALGLNTLVAAAVPRLSTFCQVIHLTGTGRAVAPAAESSRYHAVEFLTDDMPHALAVADLVVSRAGMGTLSELAALAKPALIVPMPGSHQLANARAFERLGAVEVAAQETLTAETFAAQVHTLLTDQPRRLALTAALAHSMPSDAGARIAHRLLEIADSRRG